MVPGGVPTTVLSRRKIASIPFPDWLSAILGGLLSASHGENEGSKNSAEFKTAASGPRNEPGFTKTP